MADQITVRGPRLTIDLLLYRRYGIDGQSLLEETLNLNSGISSLGSILPLGTVVIIPGEPASATIADAESYSLFD